MMMQAFAEGRTLRHSGIAERAIPFAAGRAPQYRRQVRKSGV
ncbi:Uncharacterised protein [uncultured Eubacterium sp.]|nr:hypothetical protein [Brotomerdimonas butyrica]SCG97486.1 Uncharacterised protein [uncultured Eubacterium sp.]